jgi:hypothetical protein
MRRFTASGRSSRDRRERSAWRSSGVRSRPRRPERRCPVGCGASSYADCAPRPTPATAPWPNWVRRWSGSSTADRRGVAGPRRARSRCCWPALSSSCSRRGGRRAWHSHTYVAVSRCCRRRRRRSRRKRLGCHQRWARCSPTSWAAAPSCAWRGEKSWRTPPPICGWAPRRPLLQRSSRSGRGWPSIRSSSPRMR